MDDLIKRQDAIDALWKALYDYENKTEKQFLESEELNADDWFSHRIFVQNMSDIDRQAIIDLPSAQQWSAIEKATRALKLLGHLKDRPCAVCEFRKENGCCKWSCVFDEAR